MPVRLAWNASLPKSRFLLGVSLLRALFGVIILRAWRKELHATHERISRVLVCFAHVCLSHPMSGTLFFMTLVRARATCYAQLAGPSHCALEVKS